MSIQNVLGSPRTFVAQPEENIVDSRLVLPTPLSCGKSPSLCFHRRVPAGLKDERGRRSSFSLLYIFAAFSSSLLLSLGQPLKWWKTKKEKPEKRKK